MNKFKKALFAVALCSLLLMGFGQLTSAAQPFSIGPCATPLANPSWPFLYICPDDNCYYASTIFTCTDDNGVEVPILERSGDCDWYYCIND